MSSSKVTPPVTEMALVVGPIEPATKRGRRAWRTVGRGLARDSGGGHVDLVRALAQAVLASTSGVPPKVLVSTMSAPASR